MINNDLPDEMEQLKYPVSSDEPYPYTSGQTVGNAIWAMSCLLRDALTIYTNQIKPKALKALNRWVQEMNWFVTNESGKTPAAESIPETPVVSNSPVAPASAPEKQKPTAASTSDPRSIPVEKPEKCKDTSVGSLASIIIGDRTYQCRIEKKLGQKEQSN